MIFGGQSSEHDVSCVSAANVIDGLREDKYDIYRIGITKEGKWLFVEDTDSIRDGSWVEGTVTAVISPDHGKKGIWKVTGNDVEVIPIDVAFPVLHGKFGEDGTIQGLFELAEGASGSAAKLAKDILSEKDSLGQSLESVTYEKTDRYLNQLSAHLDYLGVIIGLSPMLGLLGTITGMMGTFSSMTGQLQNTAGVTAGLAEALITTIFGLVIAITGMLVHAYLNARYKKAMLDLDAVADALISGLSGK